MTRYPSVILHSVSSLPSMQAGSSSRAAFSSPVEENMKASVGCRRRTGLSGSEIALNKGCLGGVGELGMIHPQMFQKVESYLPAKI